MSFCNLQSKRVLVTGASSGIGKATAQLVARQNGIPILFGRNLKSLLDIKTEIEKNGFLCGEVISQDLSTSTGIDLALNKIIKPIDGIVFSAGISKLMPIHLSSYESILETFSINTISPLLTLAKVLKNRKLNLNSSVIFLSSIAASTGTKGTFAYSASKGALNGTVKALAHELSKKFIRVNSVAPAVVRTNIWAEDQEKFLLEQEKKYPLGMASPEDIAATIIYLLSDNSKIITGQNIVIDSGCTDIS